MNNLKHKNSIMAMKNNRLNVYVPCCNEDYINKIDKVASKDQSLVHKVGVKKLQLMWWVSFGNIFVVNHFKWVFGY